MTPATSSPPPQLANILVVDDDDVDIMMIKRSFKRANLTNPLHIAHNGLEALDLLRGTNGRKKVERPLVILLDMNMPRMNGLEFLEAMRSDPALQANVVFIQTTSGDHKERQEAYQKHVAGYIVKRARATLLTDMLIPYLDIVALDVQ